MILFQTIKWKTFGKLIREITVQEGKLNMSVFLYYMVKPHN